MKKRETGLDRRINEHEHEVDVQTVYQLQAQAPAEGGNTSSEKKGSRKKKARRRLLYALFYVVGLAVMIFGGIGLFEILSEDRAAQSEYDELRTIIGDITLILDDGEPNREVMDQVFAELSVINPNVVGWIYIPATDVNYPVVRGPDNDFYLRRTFRGEYNRAGSIFMDYRVERDFTTPLTTLYGHNMRDGSMFASLMQYTSAEFLAENTEIRIITNEGDVLTYEIIKAWRTDAWDDVYAVNFDSGIDAQNFFDDIRSEHFLVLSTCWSGADRHPDDRFIVAAVRVGVLRG